MSQRRTETAKQLQEHDRTIFDLLNRLRRQVSKPERLESKRDARILLTSNLRSLHSKLQRHFDFEESEGFMEEVLASLPNVSEEVQVLQRKHQEILTKVEKLCERAEEWSVGSKAPAAEISDKVVSLAKEIKAHEVEETRLWQRAFLDDVGAMD